MYENMTYSASVFIRMHMLPMPTFAILFAVVHFLCPPPHPRSPAASVVVSLGSLFATGAATTWRFLHKNRRVVKMVLVLTAAVSVLLVALLALAAYTRLWAWREWFPYHGNTWTSFDVIRGRPKLLSQHYLCTTLANRKIRAKVRPHTAWVILSPFPGTAER